MTDKAEERIWAWEYKGHTPWGPIKPDLDVVTNGAEYIRADIHQALKAELREARMQSLADLGQAQDAYEAQREAEAERDHARKGFSLLQKEYEQVIRGRSKLRDAMKAIGETEND